MDDEKNLNPPQPEIAPPERKKKPKSEKRIAADRKEYQRRYYAARKAAVRDYAYSRYNDPKDTEYRDRIKAARRAYYHRTKEAKKAIRRSVGDARRGSNVAVRVMHPTNAALSAIVTKCGTRGLANACGCSNWNILKFERMKYLPPATWRTAKGDRIYLEDQVEIIAKCYKKWRYSGGKGWTKDFSREVTLLLNELVGGVLLEKYKHYVEAGG